MLKDRFGFMWFGTQDGLNRYDGFKFTVYKHIRDQTGSLPANSVNALCEDGDGNIWVGTRLGGLSKYDRSTDSFVNYRHNETQPASLSDNSVNVIFWDKRSGLWIGTVNGLNLFNFQKKNFQHFSYSPFLSGSLSSSNIYSIAQDFNGDLWVGTIKGLNRQIHLNGEWTHYLITQADIGNGNSVINTLTTDEAGNIWAGTNRGLNLVESKTHQVYFYAVDPDKNSTGGKNNVYSLVKTRGDQLWIGSNTTLQLFDTRHKHLVPINNTETETLMPNDGIYCMLEDNAGILWIGTSSQGVIKYDKNLPVFPVFDASLLARPSAKNIIRGIAEDRNGVLYLATDVGLKSYNRSTRTYHLYQHDQKGKNSLTSNYTSTILFSPKRNGLWIGTYANGLDFFDLSTGTFRHYIKGKSGEELSSNAIYALMEDKNGNLYIGTDQGGLNVLDYRDGSIAKYMPGATGANCIADSTIQAICQDCRGHIWLGGYSKGISIFDPQARTFTQYNTHNTNLTSDVVSTFYEDAGENMWVGTMEGGLNKFDAAHHRFVTYTEENGLVNNTINYITADGKGILWFSTLRGLSSFNYKTGEFKNYGTHNGLAAMESNLNAGLKLKDGKIAIGGINGFNLIDPENVFVNANAPPVVITGLELFNKAVTPDNRNSPLKQNILITKQIDLNYAQSVFSLEFAALDYTMPESNKYAYKLEGFDRDWQSAGNQRKATYTNLSPGTYTFLVKAANNDGVWSKTATKLVIRIIPPYWMTWWFRCLCLFSTSGVIYLIYLFKVNLIKQQRKQLKNEVILRTVEISQQSDHLRQLNNELQTQKAELEYSANSMALLNQQLTGQKNQEEQARIVAEKARQEADKANSAKSAFLATMSHEIRTPMNGVLGMASLLSETQMNAEQQEYLGAIVNSGETLLGVINDILDFSKIESGKLELDPHDFDLKKCVKSVLELFINRAKDVGINLRYEVDQDVPGIIFADGMRLRQILINLIGNAVKFTHKGEVFIYITADSAPDGTLNLHFKIKDTGIGIKEDKLSSLFTAFNQVDSSVSRKYGGTGLGLVISERLVHLMQGAINVESRFGVGSTFSFFIKCQNTYKIGSSHTEGNLLEGKQALVICNNKTETSLLSAQLLKWKMLVTCVASGREGLYYLSQPARVDLILTDAELMDMDGAELATHVREINTSIPIVLLTAKEFTQESVQRFNEVLQKPFRLQRLYEVLARYLKNNSTPDIESKKSLLSTAFAAQYPFHILVAEDNMMNQKLILRVLSKLGYQADLANDGQEALDLMAFKPYDLVLMDMQMPNIDGLQATRLIRQKYGARPLIVAVTANALSEDKQLCLDAGMDDYLSKPISIELLVEKLMNLHDRLTVGIDDITSIK